MASLQFRAWHVRHGMSWEDESLGVNDFWGDALFHGSPLKDFDPRDFTFLQYTGIKDKHGKEIYDGDIVVQDTYPWFDRGRPNYRGTVEWIYCQWQVVSHCVNPGKRGMSDGVNNGLNYVGWEEGDSSAWEVIGNIYAHPELLEPASM